MAMLYTGFGWLPHYIENNLHMWTLERIHETGLLKAEEEERILGLPRGTRPYGEVSIF